MALDVYKTMMMLMMGAMLMTLLIMIPSGKAERVERSPAQDGKARGWPDEPRPVWSMHMYPCYCKHCSEYFCRTPVYSCNCDRCSCYWDDDSETSEEIIARLYASSSRKSQQRNKRDHSSEEFRDFLREIGEPYRRRGHLKRARHASRARLLEGLRPVEGLRSLEGLGPVDDLRPVGGAESLVGVARPRGGARRLRDRARPVPKHAIEDRHRSARLSDSEETNIK